MATVLLRLTWFDALRSNAELDPPYRKLTESTRARRRKRRTVVRTNHVRKAEFEENRIEHAPHVRPIGLEQHLAAQQVTGTRVHDGQRVDDLASARAKLSFEVDAPHRVRLRAPSEWLRPWHERRPTFGPRARQPMTFENVPDRTCARHDVVCLAGQQNLAQLAWPPPRSLLSEPNHDVLHRFADRRWAVVWAM